MNKIEVFTAVIAIFSGGLRIQAVNNDSPFSLYGLQNLALPLNLFQYPTGCLQEVLPRGKFVAALK